MGRRLEGKVAVITGGNSGIGASTGQLFAEQGARVVLMARREEQGQMIANSICDRGGEAIFVGCDVGDYDSVCGAVNKAVAAWGKIDLLFNNAGGGAGSSFPNEPIEECQRVINTNLTGTFFMSQMVWPHLVKGGGGAVVNMSSLACLLYTSPSPRD